MPFDCKKAEILERFLRTIRCYLFGEHQAPQRLRNFDIYELWRMQALCGAKRMGRNCLCAFSLQDQFNDR